MPNWSIIREQIRDAGADVPHEAQPRPVHGGDISAAWRLGSVFVKTGPLVTQDMFAAEAEALQAIAQSDSLRVPQVVARGDDGEMAYIALEWLTLEPATRKTEAMLGEQLAAMHNCTATLFGWHRANYIGLTPQVNTRCGDWLEFVREHRLNAQLRLADANGFGAALQRKGEKLMKRLPIYFGSREVRPSLLHGDLWGGNWGSCDGEAVVFDPATYYGDRESDLAMTRLFGGFGAAFYDAYESCWPREPGHKEREQLYQLYHLLNHLNLFGSGYLSRTMTLIEKLI